MRLDIAGPQYLAYLVMAYADAFGQAAGAPVGRVFRLYAMSITLFFISSLTGGVPGFRVLSRKSESGPATLYLFTYAVTHVFPDIPLFRSGISPSRGSKPPAAGRHTCAQYARTPIIVPLISYLPQQVRDLLL
jgi:hypothetical protein